MLTSRRSFVRGSNVIATCLAAWCVASATECAQAARRGPLNLEEPWVFRTVLDERPRVLVVALGDAAWAAWDTQSCALYQVWRPGAEGVKLTGAVFDGNHGPQPVTDGTLLFRQSAEPVWLASGTTETAAAVRYRAHRLGAAGRISLFYAITLPGTANQVLVEESPTLALNGSTSLIRSFRVSGLPSGARLVLKLAGSTEVWKATGAAARLDVAGSVPKLVFTANGDATLIGEWRAAK